MRKLPGFSRPIEGELLDPRLFMNEEPMDPRVEQIKARRTDELRAWIQADRNRKARGRVILSNWYFSVRDRGTWPGIGRLPSVVQLYLREIGIGTFERVMFGPRDTIIAVQSAKGERIEQGSIICQADPQLVIIPAQAIAV